MGLKPGAEDVGPSESFISCAATAASAKNAAFPELDLELLVSFLDEPTVTQAVRAYRKALG